MSREAWKFGKSGISSCIGEVVLEGRINVVLVESFEVSCRNPKFCRLGYGGSIVLLFHSSCRMSMSRVGFEKEWNHWLHWEVILEEKGNSDLMSESFQAQCEVWKMLLVFDYGESVALHLPSLRSR